MVVTQFVGTEEPAVEELLPPGEKPVVQAYIVKYIWLVEVDTLDPLAVLSDNPTHSTSTRGNQFL